MFTDTEIKYTGLQILTEKLGELGAEKFISLIIKEKFDYTKWQRNLWQGASITEISELATKYRQKSKTHNSNKYPELNED